MHPRLLIFDLDGTLIDSRRDIVSSVNRAFIRSGLPAMPDGRIGDEIGRGSEYLFRRLLGQETPSELIGELVAGFKESYAKHLADHTTVYPGVERALTHFSALPKVVVTNKNQAFADRLMGSTGLRSHFEAVFGSEAFTAQKPDPRPLLETCGRWGIPPKNSVIIGDSVFDLLAGKGAGLRTVAALYGFSRPEQLRSHHPDHEIESADALIGLFPSAE